MKDKPFIHHPLSRPTLLLLCVGAVATAGANSTHGDDYVDVRITEPKSVQAEKHTTLEVEHFVPRNLSSMISD